MNEIVGLIDYAQPFFQLLGALLFALTGVVAVHALRKRFEWAFAIIATVSFISFVTGSLLTVMAFLTTNGLKALFSQDVRQLIYVITGALYPIETILFVTGIILLIRRFLYVVPPPLREQACRPARREC